MCRRWKAGVVVAWLGLAVTGTSARAQQSLPAPPPARGGSVVQSSKSVWTGAAITALACGAGIFAVMKTSARN